MPGLPKRLGEFHWKRKETLEIKRNAFGLPAMALLRGGGGREKRKKERGGEKKKGGKGKKVNSVSLYVS